MSLPTLTTQISVERVLANAADGFFVIDRRKRYVMVNAALEQITGYTSDELLGRQCPCSQVAHCKDEYGRVLGGFLCPARAIFEGDQQHALQRMEVQRADGRSIWVETQYSAIRDRDGDVEFVLGVVRDASESKARTDELREHVSQLRKHLGDRLKGEPASGDGADGEPAVATAFSAQSSPDAKATHQLDRVLKGVERQAILRALEAAGGQRTKAARIMGISRSRLYRRIDALGIKHAEGD